MADCTQKFINYLVDQTPHFAPEILKSFHPMSGTWLGKVATRTWPSFMGNIQTYDKFEQVFPNPVRQWVPKEYEACEGNPCDPDADKIGWGNSRYTVAKETRHWETALLCFDQIRDVSHAKEHLNQIITDILAPATDTIMSYYMKKRACQHAKRKYIAGNAMTEFEYNWVVVGDDEVYIDTNADPNAVYKMSPQLLQRVVTPLRLEGYFKEKVLADFPGLFELITDDQTIWELIHQTNTGTANLGAQWQYEEWGAASDYWKYGLSGRVGNFALSVDPFPLRFTYVGRSGIYYRYRVILPYRNVDASTTDGTENWSSGAGLRMEPNPKFDEADFQFSIVWNRGAGVVLVANAESVHPQMPFMARDLAGKMYFANTELGCENIRKNKGKFYGDFELAWKPEHPEWSVLFFHAREPACVPNIEKCYPYLAADEVQYYSSENEECDLWWGGLEECEEGEGIRIPNGGIVVNGVPVTYSKYGTCESSVAAMAAHLNADPITSLLGTWSADDMNGDGVDDLVLSDPITTDIDVTIECCSLAT